MPSVIDWARSLGCVGTSRGMANIPEKEATMAEPTAGTLKAQVREETGKGAARRARRAGLVPAVIYGHAGEPVSVNLPAHDTFLLVRGKRNPIVTVHYAGRSQLVLVREIQRNPVTRSILHLDLLAVREGELVDVEIPVTVTGVPASGGQVAQEEFQLKVRAPLGSIPDVVTIDVADKPVGTVVRVRDVDLPSGVVADVDPTQVVLSVTTIEENEVPEAAAPAAEPGVAPAVAPEAGGSATPEK